MRCILRATWSRWFFLPLTRVSKHRYDEPVVQEPSPVALYGGADEAGKVADDSWGASNGNGAILMRTVPVILGENLYVRETEQQK